MTLAVVTRIVTRMKEHDVLGVTLSSTHFNAMCVRLQTLESPRSET
jgi:hypothetical protein